MKPTVPPARRSRRSQIPALCNVVGDTGRISIEPHPDLDGYNWAVNHRTRTVYVQTGLSHEEYTASVAEGVATLARGRRVLRLADDTATDARSEVEAIERPARPALRLVHSAG